MRINFLCVISIFVLISFAACSGKNHLIPDKRTEAQAVSQKAISTNSSSKPEEGKPEGTLTVASDPETEKQSPPAVADAKDQSTPSITGSNAPVPTSPIPEEKNRASSVEEKQLEESKPTEKQGEKIAETPAPPASPSSHKKEQTPKKQTPPSSDDQEEMVFNFDNADINEVINVITDQLGINYIAPPGLTGVVNIQTKGKLAKKDLFSVLETILKLNNFTMIKKGDLYYITPLQTAKQDYAPTVFGRRKENVPLTDIFTIQIVPLKYASAAELSKVIQPLMTQAGQIIAKDTFLILIDTSANINKLLGLIELFDVDIFEQVHMQLYEVKKADVEEMAIELDTIFKVLAPPAEGQGPRSGGISFVPITRINMLMTVSSNDALLEKALEWAKKLDTEMSEGGVKIFVYFVQNAKAIELANVLNQVFLGLQPQPTTTLFQSRMREIGQSPSSTLFPSQGTSSSLFPSQGSSQNQPMQASSQAFPRSNQPTPTSTQTPTQPSPPTTQPSQKEGAKPTGLLKGEVQIVVDETTNAILIQATERDYRVIEKTLKQLDIYPKQVLIEVMIAEVRLDDALRLGVEWKYTKSDISNGVGLNPAAVTGLSPSDFATAFPSGLQLFLDKTGRFQADIRALAEKNKVNILSSPHIIASDNKEAEIDVTQEVPISSGTVTTTSAEPVVTTTTEYRDTGIILKVIPHINDKGLVTLDISQEVSQIDNATHVEGNDNPVFLKRAALTSMVVQNGQTVIIGGLITETRTRDKEGVPYLSRIPFFGGLLFGYQNKEVQRSELMLLLTPHVITSIQEADSITKEFQERLNILKNHTNIKVPATNNEQPLPQANER